MHRRPPCTRSGRSSHRPGLHGQTADAWPRTSVGRGGRGHVVFSPWPPRSPRDRGAADRSRRRKRSGRSGRRLARNPRMAGADPPAHRPCRHRRCGSPSPMLIRGPSGRRRRAGPGRLTRPGGRPGPAVYAGWRDTVVAFMAPGSGKTTAQAIPFVLSAPGAVIATSNKSDLWAATAALRAPSGGRVWLFDPQHITYQPQTWWWTCWPGCGPSKTPTAWPGTSCSPSPTKTAATCGARPPRTCSPRCSSPRPPPTTPCTTSPNGSTNPPSPPPSKCSPPPGTPPWPRRCAARRTAPPKPATASTRPPAPPPAP